MAYYTKKGECYSNLKFPKAQKLLGEKTHSKGIDVSQYQGDIDWETVQKNGIDYAIIRFSGFYGYHDTGNLNIDKEFFDNVLSCRKIGMPYGIYCYSTALTEAEAKQEAREIINVANEFNLSPNLDIFCDIEMKEHFNNPSLSSKIFKAFKSEIENAGFSCGLYASYSLCKTMCQADPSIKNDNKWVAWYTNDSSDKVNRPSPNDITFEEYIKKDLQEELGLCQMVQVSRHGKVKGITNEVDLNISLPSKAR